MTNDNLHLELATWTEDYIHQITTEIIDNILRKLDQQQTCEVDNGILIYQCPHCSLHITTAISELCCRIFRHGFNTQSNSQISPHESEANCQVLLSTPGIIGCCKPYQIVQSDTNYHVQICGYI